MNSEIINLFRKYYHNQYTSTELDLVMELFSTGRYQQEWDLALQEAAEQAIQENLQAPMSEQEIATIHERIINSITPQPKILKQPSRSFSWRQFAVAASVLLVASLALFLSGISLFKPKQPAVTFTKDIPSGKSGATLTLSDGRKILINDVLAGKIATEPGVKISKTKDGQLVYELTDAHEGASAYNTLSTSRAEQSQVRLPDGTLVFLNAESSLNYPTSFAKAEKRTVSLTGEGYFEVAKDKAHPFVVKSPGQNIEVLGTHFNVNSYNNEAEVRTTLLEGLVKVNAQFLKPGEQSGLKNGQISIRRVDLENVIAWKNGNFLFEDEPLQVIMRKIERWYDVEVSYESGVNKEKLYWGGISKYDNVSKVLERLALAGNIHFKIEGRRIMVMQ